MADNKRNIVLIGMSGCGKSTVGEKVAKKLGMSFIDADRYLEDREGRTIKEIFSQNGEAHFRSLEAEVCAELAQRSGAVIATGGGAVKNPSIMKGFDNALKIFIKRDIRLIIATADKSVRPLFTDAEAVKKLYAEREALYYRYSDVSVENDDDVERCVDRIADIYTARS